MNTALQWCIEHDAIVLFYKVCCAPRVRVTLPYLQSRNTAEAGTLDGAVRAFMALYRQDADDGFGFRQIVVDL